MYVCVWAQCACCYVYCTLVQRTYIARSSSTHVHCMLVQCTRALHAYVEDPANKLAPAFTCLHYIQSTNCRHTHNHNHITFHTPPAYPPPPEDLGGGPPYGEGRPHYIP